MGTQSNRDIKFRAWDKDKKHMVYVFNGHSGYCFAWEDGKLCLSHTEGLIYDERYYEIMQYSGLKDKNGVEIYKGDIVGYGDNYPCEVVWNKKACKFEVVERGNSDGMRFHNLDAYTVPWEVLGNIYEHRELLEI